MPIGNSFDKGIIIGPMVEASAKDKAEEHLQDAIVKGAKVATGRVDTAQEVFLCPDGSVRRGWRHGDLRGRDFWASRAFFPVRGKSVFNRNGE